MIVYEVVIYAEYGTMNIYESTKYFPVACIE